MTVLLILAAILGIYAFHVWSYNHGHDDGYAKGRARTFHDIDKAKEAEKNG